MSLDPQSLAMMQAMMRGQDPGQDPNIMGMGDPNMGGSPVQQQGNIPQFQGQPDEPEMMDNPQEEQSEGVGQVDSMGTIAMILHYIEQVVENPKLTVQMVASAVDQLAGAIQKLSSLNQAQADPQQELNLKRQELEHKSSLDMVKLQMDAQVHEQKLQLEREKHMLDSQHKHDIHMQTMQQNEDNHKANIYFQSQKNQLANVQGQQKIQQNQETHAQKQQMMKQQSKGNSGQQNKNKNSSK